MVSGWFSKSQWPDLYRRERLKNGNLPNLHSAPDLKKASFLIILIPGMGVLSSVGLWRVKCVFIRSKTGPGESGAFFFGAVLIPGRVF
jgi:hypothetical protein